MSLADGPVARAGRSLGTVGVALLTSSALGYVLLVVVARVLPQDQYAVFLSIWGVVFGLGSVLSVVEQEVSRQAAVASGARLPVPRSAIQVAVVAAVAALTGAAVVAVSPLGNSVLGGSRIVALLLLASTAGFAVQFFARGVLVGRSMIRRYSAVLVIEPTTRLLAASAVALVLSDHLLTAMVAAVALGSFAWLPVVRSVRRVVDVRAGAAPWRTVTRTTIVLGASSGLTACLLTGYPAIVTAVVGDSGGLATLFAVITITRIPLVLLAPVQAMAVPAVVRLVQGGQVAQLRGHLRRGAAALTLAAVAGAVLAAVTGPWLVRIMFGDEYRASGLVVALLLVSTVLIAAVLLEGAALLALQRYGSVLLTWSSAVMAALALLAFWPGGAPERGVAGLVAAAVVGCVVGSLAVDRATASRATAAGAASRDC